jgi:hypothetical protein
LNTPFLDMIAFMREFIELREQDGGFMPMCSCGEEKGELGAILMRDGEWLVRCPSCLATEPQDDVQTYDTGEVIALSLAKYGKCVSNQPDGDGWKITWKNRSVV